MKVGKKNLLSAFVLCILFTFYNADWRRKCIKKLIKSRNWCRNGDENVFNEKYNFSTLNNFLIFIIRYYVKVAAKNDNTYLSDIGK